MRHTGDRKSASVLIAQPCGADDAVKHRLVMHDRGIRVEREFDISLAVHEPGAHVLTAIPDRSVLGENHVNGFVHGSIISQTTAVSA